MNTFFKSILPLSLGIFLMQYGRGAAQPNATPSAAATKPALALTNLQDRVGYAIGMSIGDNLKRAHFDVNLDELRHGIQDTLAGKERAMTEQDARESITAYQQEKQRGLLDKNLKEGEAFMAENRTKEGVKTKTVAMPDGTTAEFQYKVITEGTGEIPTANDTVSVNYRGTLINGTEFDSSARHGSKPARFGVKQVVRGWTEALQLMKAGSKWQLVLPSSLAYGDRGGMGGIEPGATLIFEIELLSTEAPVPPKPVTSDIIRVPSSEEMKAGAKIEVIKGDEAEKLRASKTNAVPNAKP